MGLGCGSGVASHNASTTAHANGLTTLANLYIVAAGKLGWSDAYLTRSGVGEILTPSLSVSGGVNFAGYGAMLIGLAANVLGVSAGDSIYFDHLGAVRVLSGAGAPGASVVGDLYFDNTNYELYVHSAVNWRKVVMGDAGFA